MVFKVMMVIMSCLLILQNFMQYRVIYRLSYFLIMIMFTYLTFYPKANVPFGSKVLMKFKNYIAFVFAFSLFVYAFNYWINELKTLICKFIEAQSVFKHIFDNSEESIIIFTGSKVEYVNDTFLQ